VKTIKRQTRAVDQSPWVRVLPMAYRLYACSVCDTEAPQQLQLRLVVL